MYMYNRALEYNGSYEDGQHNAEWLVTDTLRFQSPSPLHLPLPFPRTPAKTVERGEHTTSTNIHVHITHEMPSITLSFTKIQPLLNEISAQAVFNRFGICYQ